MSRQQGITWVAVPHGTVPGPQGTRSARLSVFVAPELGADEAADLTLAGYPDLLDWPGTASLLDLTIEIEGGEAVNAAPLGAGAMSDVWRAVFPPTTRVIHFVAEDALTHPALTYDEAAIADALATGYSTAALAEPAREDPWDPAFWAPEVWSPAPPPDEPDGEGGIDEANVQPGEGDISWLFTGLGEALQRPENEWLTYPGPAGAVVAPFAGHAAAIREAFTRGERSTPLVFDPPAEPVDHWNAFANTTGALQSFAASSQQASFPTDQERAERRARLEAAYDIHRILAALGDHPNLLRRLGLIIDTTIPAANLPTGRGRIRVRPTWPSPTPPDVTRADRTPWTVIEADPQAGVFRAAGGNDTLTSGLIPLDEHYRVEQAESAATASHLVARAVGSSEPTPAGTASTNGQLPPLRTVGLRLVQRGRAEALFAAGRATASRQLADDPELDAEELLRGYRLDVLDATTGVWRSLHARLPAYRVGDVVLFDPEVDEGMFHGGFVGRPLEPDEGLDPDDVVVVSEILGSWGGWSLSVPRPGRAISADPLDVNPDPQAVGHHDVAQCAGNEPIAGMGLRIDTASVPGTLPRLRFGRSYQLRLRTVDVAGNGPTLEEADDLLAAAAPAPAGAPALCTAQVVFRRFEPVLPPEITYAAAGAKPAPGDNERRLVVRTGLDDGDATFGPTPGVAERLLLAPKVSVHLAELHGVFDDAMAAGAHDERAARRAAAYRRAIRESGTVSAGLGEPPYLADPQSAGVRLWNFPGLAPDAALVVPWRPGDTGPRAITLRLEAIPAGQTQAPDVDPVTGRVTVYLAAGERAQLHLSSDLANPQLMALLAWYRENLSAPDLERVEQLARDGRLEQVSPSVTVELANAVQRPLRPPDATTATAAVTRVPEQTDVQCPVAFRPHVPTTASIQLHAAWRDPVDELTPPGEDMAVAAADDAQGYLVRWVEHAVDLGARVQLTPGPAGSEPQPETSFYRAGTTTPQPTLDFGDTRHRSVTFTARGTTRFAEFFPPSYAGSGPDPGTGDATASRLVLDGRPVTVNVPSTRRPPAPDVLDVLPLVNRVREPTGVRHEGGWLRIWLARPWFATGPGEQLAVLVAPTQPGRSGEPMYPYSSLAGPDPARPLGDHAVPVFDGLLPEHILGSTEPPLSVVVPEAASAAALQGYLPEASHAFTLQVHYDLRKDAWYSDVRIDIPRLYLPFVRLALARWQPSSIDAGGAAPDGYRLSPVVILDPVQVLPDRTITVTRTPTVVQVHVQGPSYFKGPGPGGMARVTARIQRRVRERGDQLLAWATTFEHILGSGADGLQILAMGPHLDVGAVFPLDPAAGPGQPGQHRLLLVEEDYTESATLPGQAGPVGRVVAAEIVDLEGPVLPPI